MKKFTKQEIIELFGQVVMGEISFSRMVEMLNERVDEIDEPKYKDGDFLHSDWGGENITIIYREINGNDLYYHASKSNGLGLDFDKEGFWPDGGDFRLATESEKKELIDALTGVGKRWNTEKKCIEDIPKRKFKAGDKVKIKDGISSETHRYIFPHFTELMDEFIGKELTVKEYNDGGWVVFYEDDREYNFAEDWLEPYAEELKKGDLAIFWDSNKEEAFIGIYKQFLMGVIFQHKDHRGYMWKNAIKFESRDQYERLIKGEI